METWFRLTKQESLSAVLLKDRPEKYKYKPYPIYSEGVLFLIFIYEMEHPQAIGFP